MSGPHQVTTLMIPVDYHLHSTHSADGESTVQEMCEAAIERGLREICFTEHLDFDRSDPHYGHLDYPAYLASIEEARARYAGRLVIRIGVEFDFRRSYGAEVGEVLAGLPFDLAIGSVHTAGGYHIFRLSKEPPKTLDVPAIQAEYFAEVEALAASGWCHAIGHFDYLYKQLPERVAPYRNAWYWDRVEQILKRCLEGSVALEVNTRHLLDSGLALAADVDILRRYRELGGRRVMVGSDAHKRSDVAQGFAEAEAALRQAGFREVTGFDGGRPYPVALVP